MIETGEKQYENHLGIGATWSTDHRQWRLWIQDDRDPDDAKMVMIWSHKPDREDTLVPLYIEHVAPPEMIEALGDLRNPDRKGLLKSMQGFVTLCLSDGLIELADVYTFEIHNEGSNLESFRALAYRI